MGNFKWFCLVSLLFLSTFQQISATVEDGDGDAVGEKPKDDSPSKAAPSDVGGDEVEEDVRPPSPSASEDGPEASNAERAGQDEEKVDGFGENGGAAATNEDDDLRPQEEPSADNAEEAARPRDFGEGSPSENLGADVPEEGAAPPFEDREENIDRKGAAPENFGHLGEKHEEREEANFGEAQNAVPREFGEEQAEAAQNDGDFGSAAPRAEVEREEVGERQVEPEVVPEVPVAAPLGHPVESPHGHGHETPVKHVESPKPHPAKNSAPPSPAKHKQPPSPSGHDHASPKPGKTASPSGSHTSGDKAAKLKADTAALEKAVEQFHSKVVELHLPANVQAKVQKDANHLEVAAVNSANPTSTDVKKKEGELEKDLKAQSPKVKKELKAEEDHLVAAVVKVEKDLVAEVPKKEQKEMRKLVADVIQSGGHQSPTVQKEEKKVLAAVPPQDKKAVQDALHTIGKPPSPGHAGHAAAGGANSATDLAKLGQDLTKVEKDVNALPVKPGEKKALTDQAHVAIVDKLAGSPDGDKEVKAFDAKVEHEKKVPAKLKSQTEADMKKAAAEAANVGAESPELRKDLQQFHAALATDPKKTEVKKAEAAVAGDLARAIEKPNDNKVAQQAAKEVKADTPHLPAKAMHQVLDLVTGLFNKILHPRGGPAKKAAAAPKHDGKGKPKTGAAGSHHGDGDGGPKKAGGNKPSLVHVPSRRHGVPAA